MPFDPPLPIAQTALLVVDVQDSFKADPDRWAGRSNPAFEVNLSRLLDAFRAAGRSVFFVLHSDPDPAFEPGGPYSRLMGFLDRRDDEPLVVKTTRNSFTSTDLGRQLEARGIRRLVITGIQTEQCCETTARLAGDLGYDVDFVTEATRTFPIRHGDDVQSSEAITRATEFALRGRFARIATVEEIVRQLDRPALPDEDPNRQGLGQNAAD